MPAWRGYISVPEGESEDPSVRRWRESKKKQQAKENLNEPLWKIWTLLMPPTLGSVLTDEREMLGMLAISLCRGLEVRLATATARTMGATLASRNLLDFRRGLLQTVGVGLLSSWLSIGSGYLQARLTWKWKKKLTHMLHDLYFKGINYYLIGEGGGRGGDKLADADSRMTQDLNTTVDAFASTFSKVIFLSTEGFFYTVEIGRAYGWRYACAPYLYLTFAYVVRPRHRLIILNARFIIFDAKLINPPQSHHNVINGSVPERDCLRHQMTEVVMPVQHMMREIGSLFDSLFRRFSGRNGLTSSLLRIWQGGSARNRGE